MKFAKGYIALTIMLLLSVAFLMPGFAYAQSGEYVIDPDHSQVIFKVKHLAISTVTGSFDVFEGAYTLDSDNIAQSSVETTIAAASVNTNKTKRDDHLRSNEFLDVEKYPNITFKSKEIKNGDDNNFQIIGDLTIHGVTKEVTLDATYEGHIESDPWGKERTAFVANGEINRKDFGMTWNKALEAGGFVVGDEVRITLEVEGIRKES
jgi:polyisoprenoid-binding protein YceI